jgi:iron(II)-dependent oxidoreductase
LESASGGLNADAWIANRRYCALLEAANRAQVSDVDVARAWRALEEGMAFVPGGEVARQEGDENTANAGHGIDAAVAAPAEARMVDAYYLDRFAVTNADFQQFVADGGYDRTDLWPEEIWPHVVQFVDQTGDPGPRFWSQGRLPKRRERHPVVGVCWHEARAFAQWAGKRLPTATEWERAATWACHLHAHETSIRYPWGNAFSPDKANIWASGLGQTVEVDRYVGGSTPNGVYQLVGNVWEWTAQRFLGPPAGNGPRLLFEQAFAEIRGGAFDTYFESQATCRFQTGQPLLFRGANVGFRCAVSADKVGESPEPFAFFNSNSSSR